MFVLELEHSCLLDACGMRLNFKSALIMQSPYCTADDHSGSGGNIFFFGIADFLGKVWQEEHCLVTSGFSASKTTSV